MERTGRPVLCLHIPRTAGTSLLQLVSGKLESTDVLAHNDFNAIVEQAKSAKGDRDENLSRLLRSRFEGTRFAIFHANFAAFDHLPNGLRVLTIRSPLERLRSVYGWWQGFKLIDIKNKLEEALALSARTLSFQDFLLTPQARYLSCEMTLAVSSIYFFDNYWSCDYTMEQLNERSRRAVSHLQKFDWICDTQYCELDYAYILDWLGLPISLPGHVNATRARNIVGDIPDALRPIFEVEQEFYRAASARRLDLRAAALDTVGPPGNVTLAIDRPTYGMVWPSRRIGRPRRWAAPSSSTRCPEWRSARATGMSS